MIEYKIKINDPPQSEALTTNAVRLTVIRILSDANGMEIKGEKVRDTVTIKALTQKRAEREAFERGAAIVREDQERRGVRVTTPQQFRHRT